MKIAAVAVLLSISTAAHAQPRCLGMPGLAEVAAKLKVASTDSFTGMADCRGRNYDPAQLLSAAVLRIEKIERDAIELRSQLASFRARIDRKYISPTEIGGAQPGAKP